MAFRGRAQADFFKRQESEGMLFALHSEHWALWALLARNIKSSLANSAACADLSCLCMLLQMRGKLPGEEEKEQVGAELRTCKTGGCQYGT